MANYNCNNSVGNCIPLEPFQQQKRQRHFYTDGQLELLQAEYDVEPFPSRQNRNRIALYLGISEKSVMWWFQNYRRRLRQQPKGVSKRTRQHRRHSPYAPPQLGLGWTDPATNCSTYTAPEQQPLPYQFFSDDCSSSSVFYPQQQVPDFYANYPNVVDHQEVERPTFEEHRKQFIPDTSHLYSAELNQHCWNGFQQSPTSTENGCLSATTSISELPAFPYSYYYTDSNDYQSYWYQ